MKAAAETFSIIPSADSGGQTLTFGEVQKVFTPLKSTMILLQDDAQSICLITSHWLGVHYYQFSNVLRKAVSDVLSIPFSHVLVAGSHNHCSASLTRQSRIFGQPMEDLFLSDDQLTTDGLTYIRMAIQTAERLPGMLADVTVHWGEGRERRITHNNKGKRPDGSTYMIRHDDRMKLGEDYTGIIDDHAPVTAFIGRQGNPVAFIVQFTGHPTTAYHPDYAVVHGEYPQIACDDLSSAYGSVPVAFLQGCAADSYSLGSFSGKSVDHVADEAEKNGHLLGETYIAASKQMRPSTGNSLGLAWDRIFLPYASLPSSDVIESQLAEIDRFIEYGTDELECVGLNFPETFSREHRIKLLQPVRGWLQRVSELHKPEMEHEIPSGIDIPIASFRIGDIGFSGLPCEPFMGIGQQIRKDSPFALTVPFGYMNDTSVVNIPDSLNNGDMDFMSSTYRYTETMLQYKQPAGDLLAAGSVSLLKSLHQQAEGND